MTDSIGKRIRYLRTEANISMDKLAKSINSNSSTITYWENDKRVPSAEYIIALADFFNVSTDWILKGDEQASQLKNLGERIKFLREYRRLSMNKLEDLIGAPRGSVNNWEKGTIPGGNYLISLSDFFNVSVDWILKGDMETENSPLINPFIFFDGKWEVVSQFKELDNYEKNFIVECIQFAQYKKEHDKDGRPKTLTEKIEQPAREGYFKEDSQSYTWLPWVKNSATGDARDYYEVLSGYIPVPVNNIQGTCFIIKIEGHSMIGDGIMAGDFAVIKQQQTVEPHEIALLIVKDDGYTLKRFKRQGETILLVPSNPALREIAKPAKNIQIVGKYLYRIPGEEGLRLLQFEPKMSNPAE